VSDESTARLGSPEEREAYEKTYGDTGADGGMATTTPDMDTSLRTGVETPAEDAVLAAGETGWSPDAGIIEHRGAWEEVWLRFRQDRFAIAGLAVIVILVLVAILAPWIAPHDPTIQFRDGLQADGMPVAPSAKFLLGTDNLGRDLLSRVMWAARVSLLIGVVANSLALTIGVILGIVAGFFRGVTETLMMRATDVMMAFPIYMLAIALVSVLKPSIWILIFVIGFVYWTPMTRVIHGEVLSIREKEFVAAARLTGCTNVRILYRHILPHLVAPIIVYATLGIGSIILFEATMSYIGLGVQPPTPSWGSMIATGQPYYLTAPLLVVAPGVMMVVTVLAFNLVGDALRDALDPLQRNVG
jgi:peptide/nickel transport system permease protein